MIRFPLKQLVLGLSLVFPAFVGGLSSCAKIQAQIPKSPDEAAGPATSSSFAPTSSVASASPFSSARGLFDHFVQFPSWGACSCSVDQIRIAESRCSEKKYEFCVWAAKQYSNGCCTKKDPEKALVLLQPACRARFWPACVGEAFVLQDMGGEPNIARAVELLSCGCDHDDLQACESLGTHYLLADGVKRDPERALALFEGACTRGWFPACTGKASILFTIGKKQEAMRDWRKACDGRDVSACVTLAGHLLAGDASAKDPEMALRLLSFSCDRGEARACAELGGQLLSGRNVAINTPRAMEYFRYSCQRGWSGGCYGVAEGYELGWNGRVDLPEALKYYEIVCALRKASWCPNADRLRLQLSPAGSTSAPRPVSQTFRSKADYHQDCSAIVGH